MFVGEHNSRNVYAVDYSPINQSENIIKLLLGQDVPAEIRVRKLQSGETFLFEGLLSHCLTVDGMVLRGLRVQPLKSCLLSTYFILILSSILLPL